MIGFFIGLATGIICTLIIFAMALREHYCDRGHCHKDSKKESPIKLYQNKIQ